MMKFLPTSMAFVIGISAVSACSICGLSITAIPLRQEAQQARIVLVGKLSNPRLDPSKATGAGMTDFTVERTLKSDPAVKTIPAVITIPKYIPLEPTASNRGLIFFDVANGSPSYYRGVPVKSQETVDYLVGALAIDPNDHKRWLAHSFRFLDSTDPEVAADAFLVVARAGDSEIRAAARNMDTAKLRKIIADPQTPAERIGLFCMLLGAAGHSADMQVLEKMLHAPPSQARPALSGVLAGMTLLDSKAGWSKINSYARDTQRPFPERYAAIQAMKFLKNSAPQDNRAQIAQVYGSIVQQADVADIATEDLRHWEWWELTPQVLAAYSLPSHSAPLVRRSIVGYALACPRPEASKFIADLRKSDPQLVADVAERNELEKPILPGPKR